MIEHRRNACLNCHHDPGAYSTAQKSVQQVISVVLGPPSMAFGVITLVLVWRIRRNFRHELIILLLMSQVFKTFWLWIYAATRLATAGSLLPQPWCFADGYLIVVGNEAADVIIFCIALHTGMCVLHFKRPWARLGLEPHHRIVRVVAILYPVTMASLAFVNGKSAYVAQGSLCALPVRPFWYRLALSWIPRYLILTFIMAVSVATYTFVATSFRILSDQLNGSVSTLAIGSASFCGPVSPNDHVLHRHRAIQKELRLTFIYPVVYFLMWVPSFVNHCFGYSTKTPPFVLNTVALVCQLLQCATDCVVFNLRERPWRVKPLKRQVRTPFHHVSPVQQWWDREWADISSDDDCETSSQ